MAPALTFMFHIRGTVAELDRTVPDDQLHAAKVLIVESDDELARIVVPLERWRHSWELLAVGRPVEIIGVTDADPFAPGAHAVAESVKLLEDYH